MRKKERKKERERVCVCVSWMGEENREMQGKKGAIEREVRRRRIKRMQYEKEKSERDSKKGRVRKKPKMTHEHFLLPFFQTRLPLSFSLFFHNLRHTLGELVREVREQGLRERHAASNAHDKGNLVGLQQGG